nr:response regulator [uncultured Desulfobacter sp.]
MSREIVDLCKQTTILAIDDEKSFLKSLERLLKYPGQFLKAENGDQAIDLVKEYKVDLILLDQTLEDELGTDVLKKILKIQPDVRVVLITICEENDVRSQMPFNQNSIKAYFQKPLKINRYQRLKDTVQEVLISTIDNSFHEINDFKQIITENVGYVEEFVDEFANVILYDEEENGHQSILPKVVLERNAIYEGMNFMAKSFIADRNIITTFGRLPDDEATKKIIEDIAKDIDFELGNDEW